MGNVAMAWLPAQTAVASVIVGGRNAGQARQIAQAGDLTLEADVVARLTAATETVKQCVGDNCDMWMHESRMERA
jgi:aryl-alcohol dehydrogenase-like predicted oxidoreductase